MAKSSLERSHSAVSNFKLTLICLLLSIAVSMVWVGVVLITTHAVELAVGIIVTAVSAAVALISFLLISKFTR